jgi:hypothetical protein
MTQTETTEAAPSNDADWRASLPDELRTDPTIAQLGSVADPWAIESFFRQRVMQRVRVVGLPFSERIQEVEIQEQRFGFASRLSMMGIMATRIQAATVLA